MSEQKKIKISFSESGMKLIPKQDDGECIVLESTSSKPPVGADVPKEGKTYDWRDKVHTVQERNLIALKNSILTDITLEVGPENTPFKAHKLILALGSPVFEAMFYGPIAEQGEKVRIPDIMPDGFQALLRHIYGDTVILNNEAEALNTWIACDKYCVPKMKKNCDIFFSNCTMSSTNVWKLLENAVFLGMTALVCRCLRFLEKHTETLLRAEGFLDTKTETIKQVLNIPSINVSELTLLKSVIHWGRNKAETGEAASLSEALKPLLPHFQFGALNPEDFCQFLEETGALLDKSDALAILKHLTKPLLYPLPDWCSSTNLQRYASSSSSSVRVFDVMEDTGTGREYKKLKKYKVSGHHLNIRRY